MERNRPGPARGSDRPTYELTTDVFVEAVGCAGFSAPPNTKYGQQDFAAASCRPTAGTPPLAEARRYAPKEARENNGAPSGERIRPRAAGIPPHEAVGAFDRFTASLAAELRKRGLLEAKTDTAADFYNAKRDDKKHKPELIRGGDKKSATKAYETHARLRCVVAGRQSWRCSRTCRAGRTTPSPGCSECAPGTGCRQTG